MYSALILLSAVVFASCVEADCTLEIKYDVQPQPVNLIPGQTATPQVKVSTCSGRKEVRVTDWRWESLEPSVATVDSILGRITGVSAGQTTVMARSRLEGHSIGLIVIVR